MEKVRGRKVAQQKVRVFPLRVPIARSLQILPRKLRLAIVNRTVRVKARAVARAAARAKIIVEEPKAKVR